LIYSLMPTVIWPGWRVPRSGIIVSALKVLHDVGHKDVNWLSCLPLTVVQCVPCRVLTPAEVDDYLAEVE
jgi:hypothetical protein